MESVEITDLGCNGEGIGRIDGKVCFIPFSLPGENVEFEIIKENKSFCEGKCIHFTGNSSLRVNAPCNYFGICGGCDLQHISYQEQLKFKKKQLLNTFKKIYGNVVDMNDVIPSNEFYYRNKMVFPIKKTNDNLYLGMYKKNSHDFVKIDKCILANEIINKQIERLNDFINMDEIKELKLDDDFIKYVVLRNVDDNISLTFVVKSENRKFESILKNLNFNNVKQIYVNYNTNLKNIFSDKFKLIKGEAFLPVYEFGVKYQIGPYSFMQVNPYIKEKLYKEVCHHISVEEVVVDAYSGAGLLSAIVSKKAKKVYGIEINESAFESANELVIKNNLKNIENKNGDCLIELPKLIHQINSQFTIILDPPRSGVEKSLLQHINQQSMCNKIIYISCNPNTLCRDVRELTNYEITKIQPYDMFPQTVNVETLVILNRIKNKK